MSAQTITETIANALTRRDYALQDEFRQAMIASDDLMDEVPNGAMLVLLPDDDPELAERNIAIGVLSARRDKNVYLRHVHGATERKTDAEMR